MREHAIDARLRAEEEAEHARRVVFEQVCPNVLGNPFIPHFPHPPQAIVLGLHQDPSYCNEQGVTEILYGGAAGGGKSDVILMSQAQFAWRHGDYAGVCLRRSYPQLTMPGGLIDRAKSWWRPEGVAWNGDDKTFTFPSGAKVRMAHHGHADDNDKFQGAEYQTANFDELTHWPDDSAYRWIALSRLRRAAHSAIPLRAISGSNPGGPGHRWVQERFVGVPGQPRGPHLKAFVAARIADNPSLDRDAYIAALEQLHPTVRDQLLEGDWSARDPGDYFRREWFGPLLHPHEDRWAPSDKLSIRWWDLAASEKPEACYTSGVLMSRRTTGVRAIEHMRRFRATPGKRDDLIEQQAQTDGFEVVVGIEIEPGSGGPAQFDTLARRLRAKGYRVVGARPRKPGAVTPETPQQLRERDLVYRITATNVNAKAARCQPVASCLERGHRKRGEGDRPTPCPDYFGIEADRSHLTQTDGIRLYAGAWTQEFLDSVEGFPESEEFDVADATSGAWSWLEANPTFRAPGTREQIDAVGTDPQDLNPADRPDLVTDGGRDRRGLWTP